MGCNTFAKLYNSSVVPIMNYEVGIWGIYSKSQLSETVQNRTIRSFCVYINSLQIWPKMGIWVGKMVVLER